MKTKTKRKLSFTFIILLFTLPFASFCSAQETEYYVGVRENDVYIYLTDFDKGPFEDFYTDYLIGNGTAEFTAEVIAEIRADLMFDSDTVNEDIEAWKIIILRIDDEEKKYYDEDGVQYFRNIYVSEDRTADDWDRESHDSASVIYKYDKGVYKDFALSWIATFFQFFVANDVDWNELADKIYDEYYDLEEYNVIADADVDSLPDGLETSWEVNAQTEDLTSISRFTSQGVLKYYEWAYDGEIIMKLELELSFFVQYWVFILIILGCAVIPVILLLIKDIKENM